MLSTDDGASFLDNKREKMVNEQIRTRGIKDPGVLGAMRKVPRHRFIPGENQDRAYEDCPVPIACNQTISQPYMVAAMTELLGLQPCDHVLEIGTGSGYQAAILAEMADYVYTMERHPVLLHGAERVLRELGYTNVRFIFGDGTLGCPKFSPFDAILITAGCPDIPLPLFQQLREGGRIVAPAGDREVQVLVRVVRHGDHYERTPHFQCRFVPLIGEHGWKIE